MAAEVQGIISDLVPAKEPGIASVLPALVQPVTPRKRCIVYIDGYNFYYGVLDNNPSWKWLDLQGFFSALRPDEDVVALRYFTAIIEPERHTSERRDRQKRYLKAISTFPKIEVRLGRYQMRWVTCRATCRLEYQTPEEKKTDVNIAVSMMDDAIDGRADSIVLVSGDSDMEPAVQWIRQKYPAIKITVYIPVLPEEAHKRRNDNYLSMKVACRPLPLADISKYMLPPGVTLPDGSRVERPKEWI